MKTATILAFALVFLVTDDIATADRTAWAPRTEIRSPVRPALPTGESIHATPPMDWFNRDVHGTGNIVIGRVSDVVMSPVTGRITGLIVGVGATLGTGDKNIEIPIDSVEIADRRNSNLLVIRASRQSLQNAEAVRFDGATSQWISIGAPSL